MTMLCVQFPRPCGLMRAGVGVSVLAAFQQRCRASQHPCIRTFQARTRATRHVLSVAVVQMQ